MSKSCIAPFLSIPITMSGGSSETDMNALTVVPKTEPSSFFAVTTVTPDGYCLSASRNWTLSTTCVSSPVTALLNTYSQRARCRTGLRTGFSLLRSSGLPPRAESLGARLHRTIVAFHSPYSVLHAALSGLPRTTQFRNHHRVIARVLRSHGRISCVHLRGRLGTHH